MFSESTHSVGVQYDKLCFLVFVMHTQPFCKKMCSIACPIITNVLLIRTASHNCLVKLLLDFKIHVIIITLTLPNKLIVIQIYKGYIRGV